MSPSTEELARLLEGATTAKEVGRRMLDLGFRNCADHRALMAEACGRLLGRRPTERTSYERLSPSSHTERRRDAHTLRHRKLVTDPETGETISAGALSKRKPKLDPETGEMIRAGALSQRKPKLDPETGETISAGALSQRKPKLDPETGETISAGALSKRKPKLDPETGEMIRAGALSQRKVVTGADGVKRSRGSEASLKKYRRRREDPTYRLQCYMSSGLRGALKAAARSKTTRTAVYLGMSAADLMDRLVSMIPAGSPMTRENYGAVWDCDHIVPKSFFGHGDEAQVRACWHWTNFQPMVGAENAKKGGSNRASNAFHAAVAAELTRMHAEGRPPSSTEEVRALAESFARASRRSA
jgi:hypothetical protein